MTGHLVKFEWQVSDRGHSFMPARFSGGLRFSKGGFLWGDGYRENEGRFDPDIVMPFLFPAECLDLGHAVSSDPNLYYERMPSSLGLQRKSTYDPFQAAPTLYREFSELNLDTPIPEILAFANKWGTLGGDASVEVHVVDDSWAPISDKKFLWAEALGRWLDEIAEMRVAVEIWDMIRLKNHDALHDLIHWEDGKIFWSHEVGDKVSDVVNDEDCFWTIDVTTGERVVISSNGLNVANAYVSAENYYPERQDNLSPNDPESAARYIVGDCISEGLAGRVSAQLGPQANEVSPVLRLVPDSLIGALWLQFAIAVDGNIDYRRCEECKMWLEIAPGTGRPDRQFCSDACRMRAYRKRKAGAQ